ncbi:GbsR/MarR family transcriptional regulator [Nocardia arthritidis]|uniref:Helix-turn-helix domain-containing protein n=1 Tax=Nocardia arthritidis TaxID=228602 RepID=A0A6G9YR55_9NOCA|nr:helix-turn-helix domain-containing protein [Nocardia arthritidis]QIS15496.1 helix-turn-helix domain-containing protein [Nocardia arthritidis]
MPGGRLTQEDRRHIAGCLARGLGYAEIARQLARPTSTVSREVTRNGGPSRYRPDIAHRATERRARRRKPAIPSPGPKDAAAQEFLEHFGKLFQQGGMPRMSANVLACLYDSDSGSAVAAELAARLRVSPATISSAVGYLEEQELIRRERDGQRRRDRYIIEEDAWIRATLLGARQATALGESAGRAAEFLGPDSPAAARLSEAGEFLDFVGKTMLAAADDWRKTHARRPIRATD